jgi:F0F1-type ATP synthase membrane subunit b/b'
MPLSRKGAELEAEASEKVDQAKDKANELAADAKQKCQGK